ncbi:hypothetical protein HUT16_22310 [Kitasatospora sp. NA04385]|uniref:hypothetical protein n=1 Tax=Kitasatospora sp. NA04385 TaxID=2742135 RepID=UPI00158FAB93|nr:hypothetical protein [Kitasatospora sp. NA04385]QKW21430.1 hypothetical protein HUT16_22310 [Kitasatospora sp. NA04385]
MPGALLALLSVVFTMELEDPLFVGLRDNTSGIAAAALALGMLLVVVGAAVGLLGRSRGSRIAVLVVALPLLLFGAWRATVLAPMLGCDGGLIARQDDGSYACYE